jgi:hypothetical protein
MNIGNRPTMSTEMQDWRQLYLSALFETDNEKLPMRLAQAERALILRDRQLLALHANDSEEFKAVHKGLYALRALRTCFNVTTDFL